MGIIKSYNSGLMDKYRTISYSETGTKDPYVQKKEGFQYNALTSRTTDLERFTKLITSKPGLKFQANQALLQQTDTLKSLKGGNVGRKLLQKAVKTVTTNLTTTLSILAQVPVNGTGTHFIQGLTPSGYLQSGNLRQTGLGRFLEQQGIGGGVNGAKSALIGEPIGPTSGPLNADVVLTQEYAESKQIINPKIPGSINKTYLGYVSKELYDQTSDDLTPSLLTPISVDSVRRTNKSNHFNIGDESDKSFQGISQFAIEGQDAQKLGDSISSLKDYNQELRDGFKPSYKLSDGEDYTNSPLNIKTRLKDYSANSSLPENLRYDYINRLAEQTTSLLGTEDEDIIPFEFNIFSPGKAETFLYFRAFLNSLNDNFSGNWNGTQYIGRAEQFYTYQGFSRDITFDFKIAAFSKQELDPLYRKLNLLVGTTAPTYTQQGEFMKGTLVSLTIGDYIYQQDGFISSINVSWNTSYPWEIDLNDEDIPKLPHLIDISVTFTPIHSFNVKSNVSSVDRENYIGGQKPLKYQPKDLEPTQTRIQPATPLPTTLPTATPFTG